jgi:hypothetical protein
MYTISMATARKKSLWLGDVDDNGKTLWSNGLGHPDLFYTADIIRSAPASRSRTRTRIARRQTESR